MKTKSYLIGGTASAILLSKKNKLGHAAVANKNNMTPPRPEPQQEQQGQAEITVLTRTTGLSLTTCKHRVCKHGAAPDATTKTTAIYKCPKRTRRTQQAASKQQ
jgi:hypothetical protein